MDHLFPTESALRPLDEATLKLKQMAVADGEDARRLVSRRLLLSIPTVCTIAGVLGAYLLIFPHLADVQSLSTEKGSATISKP